MAAALTVTALIGITAPGVTPWLARQLAPPRSVIQARGGLTAG